MTEASAVLLDSPTETADLIQRWTNRMESLNLSPNTIRLYRRCVEVFAREVPDWFYADETTIQQWLEAKGGKAGTFCNRVSALSNFFKWAKKSKLRLDNPCSELDKPKIHRGVPKPVKDPEAVYQAMDEIDIRANEQGAIKRPVGQTRAMAVFLANSGLRIHEAVALDVPVPCPRSITIIGKGHKEAIVPLNQKARDALDFLGGRWPVGARATQRRFEKIDIERVTPHMWRHTFATHLVQKGHEIGTVSKLCRHSSPAITMVYAQYAQQKLEAAVDTL